MCKQILKKCADCKLFPYYVSLLEYRNTLLEGLGLSAAGSLMSRNLNGKLPIQATNLNPKHIDRDRVITRLKRRKAVQIKYYNRYAVVLYQFKLGEHILFLKDDQWFPGTV